MIEITGQYANIIVYTDELDSGSRGLLTALSNSPAVRGSVIRVMPDAHAGSWVVGTTVRFTEKVIPSLLGTDIGCGLLRLPFQGRLEPEKLDTVIRDRIPVGRAIRRVPHRFSQQIDLSRLHCYQHIQKEKALLSIGTLGGGNHFIEVAEGNFLLIHSGSRHLGAEVAKYYQDAAFAACTDGSPYRMAWISGTLLTEYIHDVLLLNEYAAWNRRAMADEICAGMKWKPDWANAEDTPHNFISRYEDCYLLRKGAISARKDEMPTIPMNMRDGSLICRGKGNPEWNWSAPHGAGRLYSRAEVKERFTLSQYKQEMKGVYSPSVSRATLDECPMAYKPMEQIVSRIEPTVEILKVIRPLYNFKAGEEE